MQPYINPNYFNPYTQAQYNPTGFNQMPIQNQMQSNQVKIVEGIDVVKATDIPMDGQTYYFPKADGTMVYSKRWLPNGTTEIRSYLPHIDDLGDKANNSSLNAPQGQIDTIESVLRGLQEDVQNLSEQINKMNKPTRGKKGDADES